MSHVCIVLISKQRPFERKLDPNHWLITTTKTLIKDFIDLRDIYGHLLKRSKTTRDRKIITLLWFLNTQLIHVLESSKISRLTYLGLRSHILDALHSRLLPSVVDDVIEDVYLYGRLKNDADDLAFMVESLLDTAGHTCNDEDSKWILADVRGLCSELRRVAQELPRSLEHHLRLLEIRGNVHESRNQWILTALASIFLPVSLACSLLSMQTRFRDLHYLLYDFCGVVVILLTLVGMILLGFKLSMLLMENLEGRIRKSPTWAFALATVYVEKLKIPRLLIAATVLCIWSFCLASFIVGMVIDVSLGGLILGYGLAGFLGLFVIFMVFMYLTCRPDT